MLIQVVCLVQVNICPSQDTNEARPAAVVRCGEDVYRTVLHIFPPLLVTSERPLNRILLQHSLGDGGGIRSSARDADGSSEEIVFVGVGLQARVHDPRAGATLGCWTSTWKQSTLSPTHRNICEQNQG